MKVDRLHIVKPQLRLRFVYFPERYSFCHLVGSTSTDIVDKRLLKNGQFCSRPGKVKILTAPVRSAGLTTVPSPGVAERGNIPCEHVPEFYSSWGGIL